MKMTIILLLILLGGGSYLYLNPDVWQPLVKDTPLEPAPTKTKLYKWQDENGQWQVTDKAPKENVDYKELEYSSDTNIVPSIKTEGEK